MQLTSDEMAANMIAYKLLSRYRRELVALLDATPGVKSDAVPVVAGYFEAEMDKLKFGAHVAGLIDGQARKHSNR